MTIIKKSGKKEEFSPEKLSRSVLAASEEANKPLSENDAKGIVLEFQQIVKGKDLITTQQIDIIVNGILYSKGFLGALEHYVSYKKR